MTITTKILEPSLWPVLEQFFRAEKCSGCWCMNHRLEPGTTLDGEPARKAFEALVREGKVSGILAFDGAAPIGWCAFDRMAELPGLDCGYLVSEQNKDTIWSIHCVSVLSGYPKDTIFEQMIAAAAQAAQLAGAKLIEGYPPLTTPSGNTFSGTRAAFESQSFKLKDVINKHYVRMIKAL